MDNNLKTYLSYEPWLVSSNGKISDLWDTVAVTSSCSGITTNAKKKCNKTSYFMALSAFAAYALCTWDMAKLYSKWYGEAQEACYDKRKPYNKTVNFLLVDWLKYYKGDESIKNKANFMNIKNIKNYLGRDVFLPEFQGCSYHPGKLYYYCWKICPNMDGVGQMFTAEKMKVYARKKHYCVVDHIIIVKKKNFAIISLKDIVPVL